MCNSDGQKKIQISGVLLAALLILLCLADANNAWADTNKVRGIVRATDEAVIASELVARVTSIPLRSGQAFKKGDILIAFDCRRYTADLRAAAAEARAARYALNANLKLQKHNAIGSSEVEISRAKLDQAEGHMQALKVRTSQCEIKAPYNGRVVKNHIHEHEMPKANEPLIEIVGDTELEIDLLVPSNWLVWLKPGTEFDFFVDEMQKNFHASVDRIGAVVDPISQTARLSGVFLEQSRAVLPGMSGTANFKPFKKLTQGETNVQNTP